MNKFLNEKVGKYALFSREKYFIYISFRSVRLFKVENCITPKKKKRCNILEAHV